MVRRVAVVGAGLIGGSIGLALTRAGAEVRAFDADPDQAARAVEMGAVADVAESLLDAVRGADIVIIATPVGTVADLVIEALDAGAAVVTDVGSVKAPILREVEQARPELAARFVGGHPMAGSEQDGLLGAEVDLFAGATWVLTPTDWTDPDAHTAVRSLVAELGAEIIEVTPGASRRDGGGREPRPAAGRDDADGRRRDDGRGALDPAPSGGRRVPRHDADRRRPSGHLARHLHREPRRDRRGPRRLPARARGRARLRGRG